MTKLEYLLRQREWAIKWLDTDESQLPGILTHRKCFEVLRDVEVALVDHMRFDAYGNVSYE